MACLLYTSDAADERSSVDLGGRRIIKKKNDVDGGQQIDDKITMDITMACTLSHELEVGDSS